jgi:mannose-6-phosphate isomerase-like protein (cupin superfamily)
VTIKPWGCEVLWAQTASYVGKLLYIRAGEALSLQYHDIKEESIIVVRGKMKLHSQSKDGTDINVCVLLAGDAFHIPPKFVHRMEAIDDVCVLEVSTPQLDDVVRLEDRYDRL